MIQLLVLRLDVQVVLFCGNAQRRRRRSNKKVSCVQGRSVMMLIRF